MRSLMHKTFGDPAEVLAVETRTTPEPGPGQVRVRLRLASVHNHDIATIRGRYGYKPPLPAAAGTEGMGLVDAVGDGVALAIGQRVAVFGTPGAWSECFIAEARNVVLLPDAVPDEMGAQLLSMPISALMLLNQLQPAPGAWLVQNAANGAVGVTLAMMAKAREVKVLSLVRRSAAVAEMADQGVADVVATDVADWRDRARTLIDGGQVVAAIDSVGGEAANDLAELLSEDGQLIAFGAMGGQPLVLSGVALIAKSLVVRGFWASRLRQQMTPAEQSALVDELLAFAAAGDLVLPVGAIFDFADVAEAMAATARPGRKGKILLRP